MEFADELERLVALHDASTIAAVIVEPIAGSTGVLLPPQGYLKRLREICDEARHPADLRRSHHRLRPHGLGRSRRRNSTCVPDMITCAKGLTNGAVPMGAVLV